MATEEQTSITGFFTNVDLNNWWGQRLTISNRTVAKLSMPFKNADATAGHLVLEIRRVSGDSVIVAKNWGLAADVPATMTWLEVTFDAPTLINEEVRLVARTNATNQFVLVYYLNDDTKANESASKYFSSWTDYENNEAPYIYTYTTKSVPWAIIID